MERAVSDRPISVRAFLRDMRWMLPLFVGVILLLWLLDVGGMGDLTLIEALLLPVGIYVVLGPILWLWWERAIFTGASHDPAFWRFFGGSAVWLVSWVIVLLILDSFGIG